MCSLLYSFPFCTVPDSSWLLSVLCPHPGGVLSVFPQEHEIRQMRSSQLRILSEAEPVAMCLVILQMSAVC